MKKILLSILFFAGCCFNSFSQTLVYHDVVTDNDGNLIPWYTPNHGQSYDHCLGLVWNFWKNLPTCCGGHKYYMIDHSYNDPVAGNKMGGDQFAMALSSWALYYGYTGDTNLIMDMKYIADTYLANSLTPAGSLWPNLPYTCNYGNPMTAVYDGDFIWGFGFVQPDKAGSFGAELVTLYKITGNVDYLQAAIKIANTLAANIQTGTETVSPYPFRINALNGNLPSSPTSYHYTTNFIPTMRLFEELSRLQQGNTVSYDSAYTVIKDWIKLYPLQTNEWGSFFENIYLPSNTEINAVTCAYYILEKGDEWGTNWQQDARGILDWTLSALGSHAYDSLGVTAIYEQSVDLKEGGSHTSRFASAELLYAEKTGDTARKVQAIRQLDWSTYLVDFDGKCRFSPQSGSVWYTDGYGDYVRHFLRAMGSEPAIAYEFSNHLLRSSSVITYMNYEPFEINYTTYDNSSSEIVRLVSKPTWVKADGITLNELSSLNTEGWIWTEYPDGGVLRVRHDNATDIQIGGLTLSEDENKISENDITVFPNPSEGNFTIHFSETLTKPVTIAVFNALGEKIKEETFNFTENNIVIDISELSSGIYSMQLQGEKISASEKLVLAK